MTVCSRLRTGVALVVWLVGLSFGAAAVPFLLVACGLVVTAEKVGGWR